MCSYSLSCHLFCKCHCLFLGYLSVCTLLFIQFSYFTRLLKAMARRYYEVESILSESRGRYTIKWAASGSISDNLRLEDLACPELLIQFELKKRNLPTDYEEAICTEKGIVVVW